MKSHVENRIKLLSADCEKLSLWAAIFLQWADSSVINPFVWKTLLAWVSIFIRATTLAVSYLDRHFNFSSRAFSLESVAVRSLPLDQSSSSFHPSSFLFCSKQFSSIRIVQMLLSRGSPSTVNWPVFLGEGISLKIPSVKNFTFVFLFSITWTFLRHSAYSHALASGVPKSPTFHVFWLYPIKFVCWKSSMEKEIVANRMLVRRRKPTILDRNLFFAITWKFVSFKWWRVS